MYGLEESVIRGLIVVALFRIRPWIKQTPHVVRLDQTKSRFTSCTSWWTFLSLYLRHRTCYSLQLSQAMVPPFWLKSRCSDLSERVSITYPMNSYFLGLSLLLLSSLYDKLVNFKLGLCYKNLALCMPMQHLGSNVQ